MATGNSSFDAIATSTLQKYKPTLYDNVFKKTPFFYFMMKKGKKEVLDGGRTIVVPVIMSANSTAAGYSGYGTIDVTPQENESAAEYVWSQYAASISISGKEERQNAESKTRVFNLLEAKTKNAEDSLRRKMDIDLLGSTLGSGSALNGIRALIDATSTVGGINRTNDAFWRANVTTSGSFATQGLNDMRTLYNTCTDEGQDAPDFAITTQSVFEFYEKSLQTQQRFTDSETLDGGFQNLKFKGMTLTFDSNVTSGEMYMINSNWIKLFVHKDADLEISPFVVPANQDAKVAKVLFMGNVGVLQSRRHGKLVSITA